MDSHPAALYPPRLRIQSVVWKKLLRSRARKYRPALRLEGQRLPGASALDWQAMQRTAEGCASRRGTPTLWPQSVHSP